MRIVPTAKLPIVYIRTISIATIAREELVKRSTKPRDQTLAGPRGVRNSRSDLGIVERRVPSHERCLCAMSE